VETTGRSCQRDEIIELAAVVLDKSSVEIEDACFSQFVKPSNPIPPFITKLNSITNDNVDTWDQGCDFHPAELHPTKWFAAYFIST
jgi:DNA polymerase III epsilon subunit-like protein